MDYTIRCGDIVHLDDDKETIWLVVHIDDLGEAEGYYENSGTSKKVWIRKKRRYGRQILNPTFMGERFDDLVSINRLWR